MTTARLTSARSRSTTVDEAVARSARARPPHLRRPAARTRGALRGRGAGLGGADRRGRRRSRPALGPRLRLPEPGDARGARPRPPRAPRPRARASTSSRGPTSASTSCASAATASAPPCRRSSTVSAGRSGELRLRGPLHAFPDRRPLPGCAARERRTPAGVTGVRPAHPRRLPDRPGRAARGVPGRARGRVRPPARERDLDERRVPLLGVTAAFIFAVQMLNFPVVGGTSGHLLGAALAAVLLGPWSACLVMAVVLTVQAFVFADGGVTRARREHPLHGRRGRAGRRRAHARHTAAPPEEQRALPRHRRRRRRGSRSCSARTSAVAARASRDGSVQHRAAGDARRPHADRRRRGRHHRRGGHGRARHSSRPHRCARPPPGGAAQPVARRPGGA